MTTTIHRSVVRHVAVLVLLACTSASAQHEYDQWFFGEYAGLDFRSGRPVPVSGSPVVTEEGTAAYSDSETGELLFYTDGRTIWSRDHRPMAYGSGLKGGISSAQSALIIPWPACDPDDRRFFVFTADN